MNRSKAVRRAWGLAVMWDAGLEPGPAAPATATVVHVVHHYVHAPDGRGRVIQATAERIAITEGEGA